MELPPVPPVRYATAADGTRIAYIRYPGELPLFMQIPTPGAPPMLMRAAMQAYAARTRLFTGDGGFVYFDWRGTGLSGPIRSPLEIADLVLDIAAVVNAIAGPVHAACAGTACLAAAIYADLNPGRLVSLWMRSPSLRFEDNWQARLNRPGWEADYRAHLEMIGRLYFAVSPGEAASLAETWQDGVPAETWAAYKDAESRADISGLLPRLTLPVWVTAERESDVKPAREVVERLADATFSIWEARASTAEQGAWERSEWERNLGSRISAPVAGREASGSSPALSPREAAVLRLVAAGHTNAEVASNLALSVRTVERHLENIYRKTGAANRTAASAWAIRNGLA